MKVKVTNIVPNPHRDLVRYPVQERRVQALMDSIGQTEFWDNILLRRKPGSDGVFELAYGHHRLEALKRLRYKVVDVPVKEIDDATMLQIMANENHEDWSLTPGLINETVRAAKVFLEKILSECDTFEDYKNRVGNISHPIWETPQAFGSTKGQGVGWTVIQKLLGSGWSEGNVKAALSVIKADEFAQNQKAKAEEMRANAEAKRKQLEAEQAKLEEQRKIEEAARQEAEKAAREAKAEQDRIEREKREYEAEQKRLKAEAERKRKEAEEAERKRLQQIKDAVDRKRKEEEAKRKAEAKAKADAEAARLAEIERQKKIKEQEESARKRQEEAKRKAEEAERMEAERKRKEEEQAERDRQIKAAELEAADALAEAAEADGVDREAYEMFNATEAKLFAQSLNRYKVPRRFHRQMAETITENAPERGVGKRNIDAAVRDLLVPLGLREKPKNRKIQPTLEKTTREIVVHLHEAEKRIDLIFEEIEKFLGEKVATYNVSGFYYDKSPMDAMQKAIRRFRTKTEKIIFEAPNKEGAKDNNLQLPGGLDD
jgi:DNA repair exonuclease SbcCD ATPase subunit